MAPAIRAQLWCNRCGLFLLSQQQQREAAGEGGGAAQQQLRQDEEKRRPLHLPVSSTWAHILARVNVLFDTALKSEEVQPGWCLPALKRDLEVQRADILYRFLQDYPIWTTI
jgi:hypothetical protein